MLTKLSLLFISAILIFVSSCGEDEIVQQTPSGTVFYSLDSLSVWLNPGSGIGSNSIIFEQTVSANTVKVEYTVQTNVDSAHSEAWVRDSSNGSPPHLVEQYYYWFVDSLASYVMDIPSQPLHLKLEVKMNTYNSIIPHYVRLKNIKVTKQ